MLQYPFDADELLKKSKKIRRQLLSDNAPRIRKKIAVLGGSTTHDIVRMMEIFLLDEGIEPQFYESEYAQYYEDAVFGNPELDAFAPDLVYIHTSFRNLKELPGPDASEEEAESLLQAALEKLESCWQGIHSRYHCPVIQNNYEYPSYRVLGNSDAVETQGIVRFVRILNERMAEQIRLYRKENGPAVYLHDYNYLAARIGLDRFADDAFWNLYKYALSMQAIPELAYSVTRIIKSIYGRNKKILALDLDNTLWGGVIGDDGPEGIELGEETALGETYRAFQSYVKKLKDIGVMLAVDSKNDEENALAGLNHPEGILKPSDFVSIRANWEPKSENLVRIAEDVNVLPESAVFADDNPAEREIVRQQVPGAAVPEIGAPEDYIRVLDHAGYFEVTSLTADDRSRSEMVRANAERKKAQSAFADYGEYLKSLEMTAEIGPFEKLYFPRITQLTNKSNQFNLTTKRCTEEEIAQAASDPDMLTLCGRLSDKFGDNGIVSLIIGSVAMMTVDPPGHKEEEPEGKGIVTGQKALLIDLWLMSCRVLKRDMEYAMMDKLVETCMQRGLSAIFGYYYPTAKNSMVRDFYAQMGFTKIHEDPAGNTVWRYDLPPVYTRKNRYIQVN
ncbi:MAG: HAD-IIIC family phosphatase [Lachnospiraceae bacterium]|nr:HAD-IIIC family phosphatase [Lachnospiraceae bacterium]